MKNITKIMALAVISTIGIGAVANAELATNTESTTATCNVSKSAADKKPHASCKKNNASCKKNHGKCKQHHKTDKQHPASCKQHPAPCGKHHKAGKKQRGDYGHAGTKALNLNIVGTWMHADADDHENEYVRFDANGTGEKWEQKTSGLKQIKDRKSFTYTFQDGVLTTRKRWGDVDTDVVYSIAKDKIRFDGDTYIRVN